MSRRCWTNCSAWWPSDRRASAERPCPGPQPAAPARSVLGCDLDDADEDVLLTHAGIPGEVLDDGRVQSLLLSERSDIDEDLDEYGSVAALDPEVDRIVEHVFRRLFVEELEAVVLRDLE